MSMFKTVRNQGIVYLENLKNTGCAICSHCITGRDIPSCRTCEIDGKIVFEGSQCDLSSQEINDWENKKTIGSDGTMYDRDGYICW